MLRGPPSLGLFIFLKVQAILVGIFKLINYSFQVTFVRSLGGSDDYGDAAVSPGFGLSFPALSPFLSAHMQFYQGTRQVNLGHAPFWPATLLLKSHLACGDQYTPSLSPSHNPPNFSKFGAPPRARTSISNSAFPSGF